MVKRLLAAAGLAAALLAGCELDEPTLGGTIISVAEAEQPIREREESPKHYEDPLVPEVAWRIEVRLDDGADVTVTHAGSRRYSPGDRVRLLVDADGALLL
jgi:outer membrane lipoprotein SlyB